jgi:pimeloyl-ACP methyl ester carboxylesterase
MATAQANGIEIEYESFGDPADPAVLLIMGFASQLTMWDEAFCNGLAARGFRVIRFDNRDIGLSQKIEGGPAPDLGKAFAGDFSSAGYTLWDMADDAAGLLDFLGIGKAHIVGASMGGMIAQAMAIRHPDRVLTLTSIMSTTGDPNVGQATPAAMAALMAPPATNREEAIERGKASWRTIGSPAYPAPPEVVAERVGSDYDRCYYPPGVARQLLAIMATGDRTEALGKLDVPTLVIHGEDDPLVTISGGRATAEAIPGAKLLTFPGMGHDFPPELHGQWIDAIVENTRRASTRA